MSKIEWGSIRYFLAIARNASLTGAAKELNVSASTVSRNLGILETAIKLPLFVKHQSGYHLTDHGQALKSKAEEIEESILSFEAAAKSRNTEVSGVVSIATAENIANYIVIPALADFKKLYPSITINILTGIPSINIGKNEADIALRLLRPEKGNVLIRKLGIQTWAFYRAKNQMTDIVEPLTPKSIKQLPVVFWSDKMMGLKVPHWLSQLVDHNKTPIKCNSLCSLYSAAKAGFGIVLLPRFIGDESNDLLKLSFDGDIIYEEVWLVTNQDVRNSKSVALVADFLTDVIKKNASFFSD